MRKTQNLPRPNNNREVLNKDTNSNFGAPKLRISFFKASLLEDFLEHCTIIYLCFCKPDFIQNFVFHHDPTKQSSEIIKFLAFYHFLPVILIIQGFLQVDPSMSKKVSKFSLLIWDALTIVSIICTMSASDSWPISINIIFSIYFISISLKILTLIIDSR